MGKLYLYSFFAIIIAGLVWQYTNLVNENGRLDQANATLKQVTKNWENDYNRVKKIADSNATIIVKVEREKSKLNIQAYKLNKELEALKYENADIKVWAVSTIPGILASRLLDFASDDSENGEPGASGRIDPSDARAEIEVQNEDLYGYANDLKSSLRSCNADKLGLREWYRQTDVILNN